LVEAGPHPGPFLPNRQSYIACLNKGLIAMIGYAGRFRPALVAVLDFAAAAKPARSRTD
jgi:hypothetical protein